MSAFRRIASKVAGGMFGVDPAPPGVGAARLRVCKACPAYLPNHTCADMKCGCDMREKTRWLTVRTLKGTVTVVCPRRFWR